MTEDPQVESPLRRAAHDIRNSVQALKLVWHVMELDIHELMESGSLGDEERALLQGLVAAHDRSNAAMDRLLEVSTSLRAAAGAPGGPPSK